MNQHAYQTILDAVADAVGEEKPIARRAHRIEFRVVPAGCASPQGHVFFTCCGVTRCMHCEKVA